MPSPACPTCTSLRAFLDRALARRGDETLAIALLDLGGFDDLKDTVGEAGEDELLNEIADRLRSDVPDGALVARMRGDRFGLVMPTTDAASALATAARHPRGRVAADLGQSSGAG